MTNWFANAIWIFIMFAIWLALAIMVGGSALLLIWLINLLVNVLVRLPDALLIIGLIVFILWMVVLEYRAGQKDKS